MPLRIIKKITPARAYHARAGVFKKSEKNGLTPGFLAIILLWYTIIGSTRPKKGSMYKKLAKVCEKYTKLCGPYHCPGGACSIM